MRLFTGACILLGLLTLDSLGVWAAEQPTTRSPSKLVSPRVVTPKVTPKGVTPVKPIPFRVTSVQFNTVSINNQSHLVAAVVLNKNIDASTVQQNINIRLLKKK